MNLCFVNVCAPKKREQIDIVCISNGITNFSSYLAIIFTKIIVFLCEKRFGEWRVATMYGITLHDLSEIIIDFCRHIFSFASILFT